MKRDAFAHLHVHTEYSLLDGLGSVEQYVNQAAEHGQRHLALTDHGNICGAVEFYHACRKADVEPIIGEEFYFVPDASARPAKGQKLTDSEAKRFHLVVLARGAEGYKVLSELSTESHRNYWHKPLLDVGMLEALGDDAQHLHVLSGCAGSIISKAVMDKDKDAARHWTMWFRETFPNFHIELQHHDTDFDRDLNMGLVKLAKRYGLPWVITNDPHYVIPEDECFHDALLAIQTASDIDAPDRFRFDGTGYHLRTRREMARAFRAYGDEIWKPGARETLRIARDCHTRIPGWEKRTWQIPSFTDVDDPYAYLRKLVKRGLRNRGLLDRPEYRDRAKYELEVIKEAGITDFLLITRKIIIEAKRRGIPVGPGRGSVCGSLVCFLIELHKIDPVRYNLLFERFLNPARPRMPDIDTDFGQARRDEVFEIANEFYGQENCVRVAAYAHMQVKAAFQSLAKAHGISFQDRIKISKTLSDDEDAGYNVPAEVSENHPDLADMLQRLAGTKKGFQNHAAGLLIAAPEARIREQMPEMWIASSKKMVGQYDLNGAEELGLMKEDFLGLRTLDTIEECVRLVKEQLGEDLDPDSWWPDHEERDDEVYALLRRGKTAGVFQMEGPTNTRGIVEIQPQGFEDIVSCTALYRTGALSAGFDKIFLENRKHTVEDIPYAHPKLQPILEPTWGVVLYQEQVMEMAAELAGFDMVQVDDIKEAIKHKKGALMQAMKPLFIEGCARTSGIKKKVAKGIFEMIEGYSGYGYNRSHAVAYSFTTYQTARLRALYPLQFLTALLRTVDLTSESGKEKQDTYRRACIEEGFKILVPDINKSEAKPTCDPEAGTILLGLTDYSGVGPAIAQRVLKARQEAGGAFASVGVVQTAVNNTKGFAVLRDGMALEPLGMKGNKKVASELLRWELSDPMRKWRRKYEHIVSLPEDPETDMEHVTLVGQIIKITAATTKDGKSYRTWKIRWNVTHSYDVRLWSETKKHWKVKEGSIVMVSGKYEPKWGNLSVGSAARIRVLRKA